MSQQTHAPIGWRRGSALMPALLLWYSERRRCVMEVVCRENKAVMIQIHVLTRFWRHRNSSCLDPKMSHASQRSGRTWAKTVQQMANKNMPPKHDGTQNSVFIQYSHAPYWQKAVTTHLHLAIIYSRSSWILIVLFFPTCGTNAYIRHAPLFLPLYLVIFSYIVHTSCMLILRCVVHFSSAPFRAATPAVLLLLVL